MTRAPRVVVLAGLPAAGLDMLGERFTVEARGRQAEPGWLTEHAPGAAAIVAEPGIPVDAGLMDAAGSSLKVVANFGVGYDNIDVEAARARGVRATNTPDVLTNATAELAVALMLAAGRRIAEADAMIRDDRWTGSEEDILGRELAGSTVGLVGFGRIAQRVAELLQGFRCEAAVQLSLQRLRRGPGPSAWSFMTSWPSPTSSASTCRSPRTRGT